MSSWFRFTTRTSSIFFTIRGIVGIGTTFDDRQRNDIVYEDNEQNPAFHFTSASLKGRSHSAPKSFNQDSYFYNISNKFKMFGVCDGHGKQGEHVSYHIAQQISQYIENACNSNSSNTANDPNKHPIQSLNNACLHSIESLHNKQLNNEINSKRSGCTLVFSIIVNNEILYTANIGDSRAIIVRKNGTGENLNIEHNGNNSSEVDRIYANGGWISQRGYVKHKYTSYGINMSRSIGDQELHYNNIITDEPDIRQYIIDIERDLCIIWATDGVWDMLDNDMIAKIVLQYYPDIHKCVEEIVKRSAVEWKNRSGRVDDITVVIYDLQQ